ncbi:DNA phosphorothioation-associated protein 4 [Streptomyces sp. NEAU-YJ-81]|uniref:DNA phosphorothioation-associated protein 4 n=1 Tax=Streptomyces sp. NEAU-YJ-81 TaxID=2820288 RepID=UPI001ABBE4E2|nr:DNA phosphorothioation-associated protein 4 [Streptomyces sp. NEAU-YJ-81]MBO3673975.1 DNA phosphorothioation-associated protein 4 [Streptomyces sp. NEAU-YJ-81]
MAEERFRRPADHEELLAALAGKSGPFSAMYEAIMFAAALGKSKGRREPFEKSGEAINLSRVENRSFGDVLLDLLAAAEKPEEAKILADNRLKERVQIFEEYANGGLNYIQGELNASGGRDLTAVLSALVMEALTAPPDDERDVTTEILSTGELDW